MSSAYHTTKGVVLRKTPYGEADFLVRVLTRDFGKIDLRIRGARKHNSKLNSHLDFLDEVDMSFVKNGDGMPTIIDSQRILTDNHWFKNQSDLTEVVKVSYAVDLLIPFEVKDVKLFSMVRDFFVNASRNNVEHFIRCVILHEGYGKASFLPNDVSGFIIKEWPALKN